MELPYGDNFIILNLNLQPFIADRTNGRTYATVLHLLSVGSL